jgi:hypothetical protein
VLGVGGARRKNLVNHHTMKKAEQSINITTHKTEKIPRKLG